ncbi:MAG TPA: hypothetical protein VFP72_14585 [Kineosporiaceae bacterium]|nr:hypothetical protein [Kineosporiaceae bacterium]
MRSDGVTGTVVCAARGVDVPLTPPGQGLHRVWEPSPTRLAWHPDDCTSSCCGRWRAAATAPLSPTSDRRHQPAAAVSTAAALLPGDGPIPCEVCGRAVTRDYVLRTGLRRHGNHPRPASAQETRA